MTSTIAFAVNMTEEVPDDVGGGRKWLLFLTNSQAELISGSSASLQKMLDALEIPRPKLVINLLVSQGSTDYVTNEILGELADLAKADAGLMPHRGPFAGPDEERQMIEMLDHFMETVILPLAAQTNAFILCNACQSTCMLSSSLTRMLSVHRSTWGREPPFTILSSTASVANLYRNPDEASVWRGVRQASRAWRQRDRKILELVHAKFGHRVYTDKDIHTDLDPFAMIYLVVDTIHSKRERLGDKKPFNRLMNELLRYLAETLPCLTINTGHSDKPGLDKATQHASSLGVAMETMLSGSPLLFLDMRDRPLIEATDREMLISAAKAAYEKHCMSLLEAGVAETFDTMSISYFHDVLFGDGDIHNTETHQGSKGRKLVHLHEAIQRAEEGRGATHDGKFAPATVHQINQTALWLATRFFSDAWELLSASVKQKAAAAGETSMKEYYADNITALSVHIRTILNGRNFHHVNLYEHIDGAVRLVGELVKLDRLPNETSYQGLLLLRSAWCEFEGAMMNATKYKLRSKLIFFMHLVISVAIIIIGNLLLLFPSTRLQHALYGLATVITVLSGLDSLLNPNRRWHQLRSMACTMEATIWMYRARVGRFQQVSLV
jgi:hypothetical protein